MGIHSVFRQPRIALRTNDASLPFSMCVAMAASVPFSYSNMGKARKWNRSWTPRCWSKSLCYRFWWPYGWPGSDWAAFSEWCRPRAVTPRRLNSWQINA